MEELLLTLLTSSADVVTSIVKNIGKNKTNITKKRFDGVLDLWHEGINNNKLNIGDSVSLSCQISPYIQLFPNNPFSNARRWNKLYTNSLEEEIKKQPMSAIAFYVGADMALRFKQKGQYTVVGLYEQYGDVGQGIIGKIETRKLIKLLPRFFDLSYVGAMVKISGKINYYLVEHAFLVSKIASQAHLNINFDAVNSLPFIDIDTIKIIKKPSTLVGTAWCATNNEEKPFSVGYCQFDNESELDKCLDELNKTDPIAYFDELRFVSKNTTYFKKFMN